jgi:undecaprenyl diphosphate synthase
MAMSGHKAGAETIGKILEKALEFEIPYVTLWGASTSNVLKRDKREVAFLYEVFSEYFKKAALDKRVHKNEVRIEVLGRWRELFPAGLKRSIEKAIEATRSYEKYHLTVLMAYSGVEEMTAAIKDIAAEARRNPRFMVKPETIASHLWSRGLPPVDLVIRTGGEPHWSEGMLMWHVANAQLHFTPTLWPDFGPEEFERIVAQYNRTERRLGA